MANREAFCPGFVKCIPASANRRGLAVPPLIVLLMQPCIKGACEKSTFRFRAVGMSPLPFVACFFRISPVTVQCFALMRVSLYERESSLDPAALPHTPWEAGLEVGVFRSKLHWGRWPGLIRD